MKTTTNFCIAAVIAVSINTLWSSPVKAQWDPSCPGQHARPAHPGEPNSRCVYYEFNPYNATETLEQAEKAFKGKKGETLDSTKVHLNIFGSLPWVRSGTKFNKNNPGQATSPALGVAKSGSSVGQGINGAMGSTAGALKK